MMFRTVATLALLIVVAHAARAQKPPRAPKTVAPAGRTLIEQKQRMSPADSAQFEAAFDALWQITRPSESVRARADKRFHRVIRMYMKRGVDSLQALEAIQTGIDTTMDRQLYRAALVRKGFTTEDIRSLTAFLRSPTGKKYQLGEHELYDARDADVDKYVGHLFSSVMAPMMKPKAVVRPVKAGSAVDTVRAVPNSTIDSTQLK
jgi:hypothetical protein